MDKKNYVPPRIYDANKNLNARWFVYWYENGKYRRKYGKLSQYHTVAERKKAAKKLLKEIIAEHKKSTFKLHYAPIKAALLWVEQNKPRWRIKTYQTLKSKVVCFGEFLELRDLNEENVRKFLEWILTRRSKTTYNHYLSALRRINKNVWKIEGLLGGTQKEKANPVPAKYFSPAQVRFLSKEISEEDSELWLVCQFIFYCFIRPAELRLLKFGDVLIDEKKILVRSEVSKNRKEQYICIPDAFLEVLQHSCQYKNPALYVFGKGTKPRRKDYYSRKHRSLLHTLHFDVSRYKLYSWKHTGAVMAVKAGISVKQLQIQLRHHSLDQVDAYLRQLGVHDLDDLASKFPKI